VGGDAGDVQPSGVVLEERERVEAVAERGVEVEEVDGDDAVRLVGQELSPGWTGTAWRWVDVGRVEDLPHGGGGDPMPEPGLALDPSKSPTGDSPSPGAGRVA
jgi:hypothetical protein